MEKTFEERIEALEKKIAELEGRVPKQLKDDTLGQQIEILLELQKECIKRHHPENVVSISNTIKDLVILSKSSKIRG